MPRAEYTADDVARRGRQLYERRIRAKVEDEHAGKFLVVDVTTGEYEVAEDDLQASDRALARNPDAVLYGLRIGEPAAYRIGAGRGAASLSASHDPWR
jgi:hypothetical protein